MTEPNDSPSTSGTARERAATRLRQAELSAEACDPVRDLIDADDIPAALDVQQLNVDHAVESGRRLVGRKIGLTAKTVQHQLGVDQPDYGALFADRAIADGGTISLPGLVAPRVEAEVAFVLDRDLDVDSPNVADVVAATAFVLPALEIVDSRIRDWDITIVDTIADNASSGLFVLGGTPTKLENVDLRAITMTLRRGDAGEVSQGKGTACLGNPVNAVVWLADTMVRAGTPLRAGDIILSGALGPMAAVTEPSTYEADLSSLGGVSVEFEAS